MSDYYQSVEWDVLSVPAQKNIKFYDCCAEPYFDIYFNITIRRKTLFYTVNLIVPCVNISFLSVLVFYLPSDSGEKLTLGISILVALLVFYLLLIELIPPTSLVIPLLGKYLLFTLILVNLSIIFTIIILNLHHRKPNTHKMPDWMKKVFLNVLPKLLFISRPEHSKTDLFHEAAAGYKSFTPEKNSNTHKQLNKADNYSKNHFQFKTDWTTRNSLPPQINSALEGLRSVNEKMKKEIRIRNVRNANILPIISLS